MDELNNSTTKEPPRPDDDDIHAETEEILDMALSHVPNRASSSETEEILDTIPSPDPSMQRGTQSFPFTALSHVPNRASSSGSSIVEDVRLQVISEPFFVAPTAEQVTNYYTSTMEDNEEYHFVTDQEEDAALEPQRTTNLKGKQNFAAEAASNAAANENMTTVPLAEGVDRNELCWGDTFSKSGWTCDKCTTQNPDEATQCLSCEEPRPGHQ